MPAEPAYVPPMTASRLTAEDLLYLHLPDKHAELVKGVLIVREPPGGRHGQVVMEVGRLIANHVADHGLGTVYAAETGFTLRRNPDTVRAPDVAFVRRERVPEIAPIGYPDVAPDLVIEVLSPGDRPGETLAKVADWLTAGTRLVWVIDPARQSARIYREDGTETTAAADDSLNGEAVLPDFSCPLRALL
jgi:Uma2 family endonuclease